MEDGASKRTFAEWQELSLQRPNSRSKTRQLAIVPESTPATMNELTLLNVILKVALLEDAIAHHRLFNLTKMISQKVKALRCSLIQCVSEEAGVVLASDDDESIQGLRLTLAHYPEITEVRDRGEVLVIPSVRASDLMAPVREKLRQTPFETMVLFPVRRGEDFFGVLSLRLDSRNALDLFYVEKFGEVCSQILSLALAKE